MTERILCTVDLSDCSHAALSLALVLARAAGARLDVLHAYYVPEHIRPELLVWQAAEARPLWTLAEEHARFELDHFLARHGADIRQRVDLHLVHKDPTSAILDFASEHGSTLIVMGTHGRTGASRLLVGSVAGRVVRLAPCPVLTVREPGQAYAEDSTQPQAALSSHDEGVAHVPKRILVAVDFSECSRLALRRAGELAKELDAKLDVVHVWYVPAFVTPDTMIGETAQQLQVLAHLVEREAKESLESFVGEARNAGVRVDDARVLNGEPGHAIVREAEQRDYDMVVLGTHGRSGLRHLLLGSVAERVVRRASRPVMTVREAALRQALP